MKVMVALDDSIYAQQYVKDLSRRTWPPNTNFKLLTVLEPIGLSEEDTHKNLTCKIKESRHKNAQVHMKEMKEVLDSIPDSIVHFEIREGSADSQIVDSAVQWEPDKLMIGAYGKGSRCETIGSTAQNVARHSPCSVEIVRSKRAASV